MGILALCKILFIKDQENVLPVSGIERFLPLFVNYLSLVSSIILDPSLRYHVSNWPQHVLWLTIPDEGLISPVPFQDEVLIDCVIQGAWRDMTLIILFGINVEKMFSKSSFRFLT